MSEEKNINQAPVVEELDLNEQRMIRREKLAKLQEMGRNPFLHETWPVDHHSKQTISSAAYRVRILRCNRQVIVIKCRSYRKAGATEKTVST